MPISKEKLALMGEITKEAAKATKAMVFTNYSPHVQNFQIDIHIPHWVRDAGPNEQLSTYLNNRWETEENDAAELAALESMLLRIMELQ